MSNLEKGKRIVVSHTLASEFDLTSIRSRSKSPFADEVRSSEISKSSPILNSVAGSSYNEANLIKNIANKRIADLYTRIRLRSSGAIKSNVVTLGGLASKAEQVVSGKQAKKNPLAKQINTQIAMQKKRGRAALVSSKVSEVQQVKLKSKQKQTTGRIATRRLAYVTRQGKKTIRENTFRNLVVKRAESSYKKKGQLSTSFIFKSFFITVTPFIGLKTRRRRKRVIHKVVPLERSRGERKSLGALATAFHSQGAVSKPFSERLNTTLESIAEAYAKGIQNASHKKRTVNKARQGIALDRRSTTGTKSSSIVSPVSQSSGSNSFREKRDEIHRIARKARPFRWLYKLNPEQNPKAAKALATERKHAQEIKQVTKGKVVKGKGIVKVKAQKPKSAEEIRAFKNKLSAIAKQYNKSKNY